MNDTGFASRFFTLCLVRVRGAWWCGRWSYSYGPKADSLCALEEGRVVLTGGCITGLAFFWIDEAVGS